MSAYLEFRYANENQPDVPTHLIYQGREFMLSDVHIEYEYAPLRSTMHTADTPPRVSIRFDAYDTTENPRARAPRRSM